MVWGERGHGQAVQNLWLHEGREEGKKRKGRGKKDGRVCVGCEI